MKTLEYTFTDKSEWIDGPWQDEIDKKQWMDEETGLPCLIVRNRGGALCGYVGVDESHPFFEKPYQVFGGDWTELFGVMAGEKPRDTRLDVHGGLTFSSFCVEDGKEHGICHIVEPGEPERVWWFGFDCAHSGDLSPAYEHILRNQRAKDPQWEKLHKDLETSGFADTYKPVAYVENECKNLALQLKAFASASRDQGE